MGDYTPVKGDRVRVVLEGEVTSTQEDRFNIASANTIWPAETHVVSIEKLEPPVVTFKPGDRVRGKHTGDHYTIGEGGFFYHLTNRWVRSVDADFNSKAFELVELVEKPF